MVGESIEDVENHEENDAIPIANACEHFITHGEHHDDSSYEIATCGTGQFVCGTGWRRLPAQLH